MGFRLFAWKLNGTGYLFLLAVAAIIVYKAIFMTRQQKRQDCHPEKMQWWENAVIYQVYPRSFKDSNGDGIGDLNGLAAKVPYLASLGVDMIWINPIYKSPMVDFGYDISDYFAIDPIFGNLDEFIQLTNKIHDAGLRLVMDFIPNHTSDQHEWFQESMKGGADNRYTDYYIWSDGKKEADGSRKPPNNWLSVFGGSAWTWVEQRQQYYYHQYAKEQPDLNFRNPLVQKEIKDILRFLLSMNIDGLRIDAIDAMFEAEDLSLDEPRSFHKTAGPNEYKYLKHIHTSKLPEIHKLTAEWRDIFKEYESYSGKHIFVVLETRDQDHRDSEYEKKYYTSGADAVYNFCLLHALKKHVGGGKIKECVDKTMESVPDGFSPSWVIGTHDISRLATKVGQEFVDVMNMLLLLLPGYATCYYGDELGMEDIEVSYQDTKDPKGIRYGPELYKKYSRDKCRSPMQWDERGGFSDIGKSWLPMHENYKEVNVEKQIQDKGSHLNFFRKLIQLRKTQQFRAGKFKYAVVNDNIFSFIRAYPAMDDYLVIINVGSTTSTDNYQRFNKGTDATVAMTTPNNEYKEGQSIDLKDLELSPGQGLIINIHRTDNWADGFCKV